MQTGAPICRSYPELAGPRNDSTSRDHPDPAFSYLACLSSERFRENKMAIRLFFNVQFFAFRNTNLYDIKFRDNVTLQIHIFLIITKGQFLQNSCIDRFLV